MFFRYFFVRILDNFLSVPPGGTKPQKQGQKVCLVLKQEIFPKPLKNLRHFDIIHGE
jgi:hypothetical protein